MDISAEDFRRLEARVAKIEKQLGLPDDAEQTEGETELAGERVGAEEIGLEFRIGEFWLAQVGALILLFGAAFFISYPLPGLPALVVTFLGYLAISGLAVLSSYWKTSLPHLSKILFGGSLVLLYFATLRVYFFASAPLLKSKALAIAAVFIVLGVIYFIAIRQKRNLLTGMVVFLSYLSALFFNQIEIALGAIVVTSAISLYLLISRNRYDILLLSLCAAYLTHLIVLFNNPVVGNPIQQIATHHYNLLYLLLYASVYGISGVFRSTEDRNSFSQTLITFLNAGGIFVIVLINTLAYFREQAAWAALLSSAFFMGLAFINWLRLHRSASSSYYAVFGYMALSAAIFIHFPAPNYYFWLGLQSLFVVVTALMFRSRIIIVANMLIFLCIFLGYFILSASSNAVNFSFALSALAGARILKWKKERVSLKTELIRNLYLTCAYVIVLYGLFHFFPMQFTSLAWLGAALLFMALSFFLKNIKYRYMSIMTVVATILHVFIVDAASLTAGFRIILFVSVGILIVLFSILYSKVRVKSTDHISKKE